MTAMMLGESHDVANPGPDGLSLQQLETFMDDMRNAPAWRTRADRECDVYDGNQHSPEEIADLESKGLPIVTVNLVAPTINLVLGMEERARTDWRVRSDGSKGGITDNQALALSTELNTVERNSGADHECSDAYASQVKAGIGWIEVARETDPFKYPYRCKAIDRREIWWDMRGDDYLLDNARWLVRKKWNDIDVLKTYVPAAMHRYIDAAMEATPNWDQSSFAQTLPMLQDNLIARDWWTEAHEWRNTDRRRACAYEVWYRKPVTNWVLKFEDGRAIEYQKKNPIHQQLVIQRMAEPLWAAYMKMRLAWWVGPFRLLDIPSPYSHNCFPYVPFWGYIEDGSRTPYGMVRSMVSLQSEVNARRSRMMWQLGATRTIVEEDAVADHQKTADEVARPDAYVVLNKNRRRTTGQRAIEIDEHAGMNAQQFEVYKDAAARLQDASGVYAALLGKEGAAEAGVAIDLLIQQGTTALAEINGNYRRSRTHVGQLLMHMRMDDMKGKETTLKPDSKKYPGARRVVFNKRSVMEGGLEYLENDTARMLWKVALDDVPSSPTFKQQKMKELVEFAKALPPDLIGMFADVVVMASDLPYKEELAQRIRQQTGQKPPLDETATPEEIAEVQQQQQASQQQAELQQRAMEAEIDVNVATAENKRADSAKKRVETIEKAALLNLQPGTIEPAEQEAAQLEGEPGAAPEPGAADVPPEDLPAAAANGAALEQDRGPPPGSDRLTMGPEMSA